jgi:hypothetical protein
MAEGGAGMDSLFSLEALCVSLDATRLGKGDSRLFEDQSVEVGDRCRPNQDRGFRAWADAGVEKVLSEADDAHGEASVPWWYSSGMRLLSGIDKLGKDSPWVTNTDGGLLRGCWKTSISLGKPG